MKSLDYRVTLDFEIIHVYQILLYYTYLFQNELTYKKKHYITIIYLFDEIYIVLKVEKSKSNLKKFIKNKFVVC